VEKIYKSVGEDFFLGEYTSITRPSLCSFGNHIAIDSFFFCSTGLILDDYIHIAPHVSVIGGKASYLKMGHFSFLSAGAKVICGSEDYTAGGLMGATIPLEYRAPIKIAPVNIEMFAGVGTGGILMPGVNLAIGSLIGAGCVVTKSTEPWGVYLGSPAKLYKIRSHEDIEKTLECARKLGY
jgi:acetyltransferase-like isoleucine patch superfamily enzyme